ncbi:MAG TPA: hypothetical protein VHU92_04030 [Streptosporangiaceae bacterium]|nr:hypothetical protein [Streptosporangiaceae bacterium]
MKGSGDSPVAGPAAAADDRPAPSVEAAPAADADGDGDGDGDRTGDGAPEAASRRRRLGRHLLLLAGYLVAGIVVTWPQATFGFRSRLPNVRDVASYVWSLWWLAHQVSHLGNPWFTGYMAAPVGIQLGFDTLMPLPGLIMTPVTLLFGAAVSFSLLTIVTPALLCYAAYRAARLWLSPAGAVAAGAFFGLSSMLAWQNWYHLNITLGTVFLPLTLEAAVRLRRAVPPARPAEAPSQNRGRAVPPARPAEAPSQNRGRARPQKAGRGPAVALGVILGAAVLTNQESAVLAALLAAAILVPWLILTAVRHTATVRGLLFVALAAVLALVVASPQLIAMIAQAGQGGARAPARALAVTYGKFGIGLPTLFSPSPRLDYWHLGLATLTGGYVYHQPHETLASFGVVLTITALAGLVLRWRRQPGLRWLALLWAVGGVLALGTTLTIGKTALVPLAARWHGVLVSQLMPFTWLIRIPGFSALREADRLALPGLVGAAVLAGATVQWLTEQPRPAVGRPLIAVIVVAGFLEAGWAGTGALMPVTLPAVDRPIAADHSGSIVVDVPFGLRGGILLRGQTFPAEALMLAVADGHPRAVSYTSWVPQPTSRGMIVGHPFYRCLGSAQSRWRKCAGARLQAARRDLRRLHVGWVLIWNADNPRPSVAQYLTSTGFHVAYRADDVTVWRPGQ